MNEPTTESVRNAVSTWLSSTWDPELSLSEWRQLLADGGWGAPSWPQQWCGKGLPEWSESVVREQFAAVGAVGPPVGAGMWLAAPTILRHGPDEVRSRFLRPTLTGEITWCQLFSEPGAGSDLAGVSTHAVRDENDWVINGQKVWNTSAHHADFGILVARTDWSVPKHQGITYFVLPMHQPGVEVRPLRQMNGHASFNEVFISDARIPAEYVVGSVNEGWSATLTTLLYERRLGMMRPAVKRHSTGCAVREAQVESDRHFATYSWYPQRAGRADLAVKQAQATGAAGDRFVRQELARLISMQKIDRWTTDRVRVARLLGRVPGPEASIGKLAMSNLARQASRVHTIVGGPHAMLSGPESLLGGVIAEVLVSVPAQSIAGGTDEIQRDILGEKVLGLPREPVSDAERPFREVLRSS